MSTWWSWDLTGPRTLTRGQVPTIPAEEVGPEQVLVRLTVAGVCGSDIGEYVEGVPALRGQSPLGSPLHEVSGVVTASGTGRLPVGQRVVGMSTTHDALREQVLLPAEQVVALPDDLPERIGIVAQPTGTVLSALKRVDADLTGRRALVIGLGSTGLLAAHVLARRGATVTGVDPVDRSDLAADFGVSELVQTRSRELVTRGSRFDLVVEAVGHQTETFDDACRLVATDGEVVAFGVPDHDDYTIPLLTFFRRNALLHTGSTQHWQHFLEQGVEHVHRHADVLARLVTHPMRLDQVPEAYELAASQQTGRVKVTITV